MRFVNLERSTCEKGTQLVPSENCPLPRCTGSTERGQIPVGSKHTSFLRRRTGLHLGLARERTKLPHDLQFAGRGPKHKLV